MSAILEGLTTAILSGFERGLVWLAEDRQIKRKGGKKSCLYGEQVINEESVNKNEIIDNIKEEKNVMTKGDMLIRTQKVKRKLTNSQAGVFTNYFHLINKDNIETVLKKLEDEK